MEFGHIFEIGFQVDDPPLPLLEGSSGDDVCYFFIIVGSHLISVRKWWSGVVWVEGCLLRMHFLCLRT